MQRTEQEDFSDLEKALENLRPVALSDRFFEAVEAELNAPDNLVALPPRDNAVRFPLRRATASAALVLCAVGLGVWGYSVLPGTPKIVDSAVSVRAAAAAPLVAMSAVKGAGTTRGKRQSSAGNGRGSFHLVNMERRMNSAKPVDCVANADGTVARRVRYSYMDEYRWEDDENGAAYVELRPHEEVVSMEMAVY